MTFKENQQLAREFEENNPALQVAIARAEQVAKEAYFSEALRVIW